MPAVLFLIDTLQTGGAEKSILEIVSRFRHYQPIVCHIYPGESLKEDFVVLGIPVFSLNIPGKENYEMAIKKISLIINEFHPVLIHATLYHSEMISRKLKNIFHIPIINSFVNNRYTKDRYMQLSVAARLKLYYYQMKDRFSALKVDLFFSNSASIAKSNSEALQIPSSKIRIIPRGRSVDEFKIPPQEDTNHLVKEFSLENKFVILTVGRLLASKGHLDLINAFAKISSRFENAMLLLAGAGPNMRHLEQAIASAGLTNKVILLGNRKEIPLWLTLCDLFVFPSHYEGLPGALIEAMMAKKIIIASDIPENLECIDHSSALIYKKGDILQLEKHLEAVINNPGQYNLLKKNAGEIAREKFDIDAISLIYEKAYDELIGKLK